ncbi:hypothetical protein GCM10009613_38110 [Pseudonocardia kongjuensis]|uniref:Uncharacterized protein n=1 Tax=Pseudonocardia kongjuensis TaxID=102227 RepID=A0ABP4IKE9_9PSEU
MVDGRGDPSRYRTTRWSVGVRRAEQIPAVAGDVTEHDDASVRLGTWLGAELDPGRPHVRVPALEFVVPEEEPDPPGMLVPDRPGLALPVGASWRNAMR